MAERTAAPAPPANPQTKGERTKERLFQVAMAEYRRAGFEGASLRTIAKKAGVSVGLLYRYFISKEAVVSELYARLSREWARRAAELPAGPWAARALWLTRNSLEVLGPHRDVLRALLGPLLSGLDELNPPDNPFSRESVQPLFVEAVRGAADAPEDPRGLGQALYLAHLSLLLFWLIDRSEGQLATQALLAGVEAQAPFIGGALAMPVLREGLNQFTATVGRGLLGEADQKGP